MGAFVFSVAVEPGAAPLSTTPATRWLTPSVDGYESWVDNELAFTRSRFRADRAEPADAAPVRGANVVCLVDARLDNMETLASQLWTGPAREFGSREAVVLGYQRWGPGCAEHLRGDFVFALWDRAKRLLLAASDPFGLRPLRFCRGDGNVLVGSRTRALAACLSQHPEWDRDVLSRYLNGDSSSFLTHTVYRGIQAVPPGHALIVSPDGTRIVRYFWPERFRAERYRRFEDYAERLYELLSAAVVRRCRGASPVAVGLSGGIDSSSVASLVALAVRDGRVTAPVFSHSLVFPASQDLDESGYQQAVLDRNPELSGRRHVGDHLWSFRDTWETEAIPADDLEAGLAQRPLRDALAHAVAADGSRVFLIGAMADHLFGGTAGPAYLADASLPAAWTELRRLAGVRSVTWALKDLLRAVGLRLGLRRPMAPMAVAPLAFGSVGAETAWRGLTDPLTMLRRRAQAERALLVGVEIRDPFLDADLVSFALGLPAWVRGYQAGPKAKASLRAAMQGTLPDLVRLRTHRTVFGSLLERGLQQEQARLRAAVQHSRAVDAGLIASVTAAAIWAKARAGDKVALLALSRLLEVESRIRSDRNTRRGNGETRG